MSESPLAFLILIAFGAFQAIFLSAIFLVGKDKNVPKALFSIFLLIEGITLVERLLAETTLIHSFPHLLGISYPISFIKPPLLYFIGLSITDPKFRLQRVQLLHFIPFLFMLLLNIPFYLMVAENKIAVVQEFVNYIPSYDSFNFFLFFSFYLYIGWYIWRTRMLLYIYIREIKNNRLASWYQWVLTLYGAVLIFGFIYFLLSPSGFEVPYFNAISMLTMTFLIQSIAYSFFSQAEVFRIRRGFIPQNDETAPQDIQRLIQFLTEQKTYLDDTLNLETFARSMGLGKKYTSDLINQKFGCSFRELINQYRVDEVKKRMQKQLHSNPSLIAIGMESGFNNKVTFYRTFKKFTGSSPSDYFDRLKQTRAKSQIESGSAVKTA